MGSSTLLGSPFFLHLVRFFGLMMMVVVVDKYDVLIIMHNTVVIRLQEKGINTGVWQKKAEERHIETNTSFQQAEIIFASISSDLTFDRGSGRILPQLTCRVTQGKKANCHSVRRLKIWLRFDNLPVLNNLPRNQTSIHALLALANNQIQLMLFSAKKGPNQASKRLDRGSGTG